jgi:dynamin-like GTPase MGM1, mitochondrial
LIKFAKENPTVKNHLELQDRKEKLELVKEKLESFNRFKNSQMIRKEQVVDGRRERKGLWGGLI